MSALAVADDIQAAHHIPAARRAHRRPNIPLTVALAEAKAVGVPAWAVAAEAGISASLLSMIARGAARVTDENARAIAQALGRSASDLFATVLCEEGS